MLFLVIYGLVIFGGLLGGAIVFNSINRSWREAQKDINRLVRIADRDKKYIIVYVLAIFLIPAVLLLYPIYHSVFPGDFTPRIFAMESPALSRFQQMLFNPLLTDFLCLVYIFGVVYLLIMTPVLVLWRDSSRRLMRRYTYMIVLNVILALPFFVLIHLTVPSVYSPDIVQPLLYRNINFRGFVALFGGEGGFHNDFPSHHVSTTFAIFIFVFLNRKERFIRYTYFCGAVALLTLLSTLYLGIHYFMDIVGGLFLAVAVNIGAYYILRDDTDNIPPRRKE